jgi:hypothetical protein
MNVDMTRGFRDGRALLGKAWPLAAASASWLLLGVGGLLEGQTIGTAASAERVQLRLLQGLVFGLVLPLTAFAVSARLGGRLSELMATAWARYGGDRRRYALGRQALASALPGGITAIAGLLALGIGSAVSAPGVALPASPANLLTVIWIALLGALCYGACFGLVQSYAGRTGATLFLVADWVFGSGTSALALPWPRGHLRALLGGAAPFELSPRDAALGLFVLALTATALHARRLPP